MEIKNNDTHAVIKWRISDCCQFTCPYCIRREFVKHADGLTDAQKCIEAVPEVVRIAKELEQNTGKKIKVDLIGGEISIIPNIDVIITKLLAEEAIDKINITSNFEQTPDVFLNKKISFTASYHPTQTKLSLGEWFNKVKECKDKCRYFKVETVQTFEATHIDAFIAKAIEMGVDYQIEGDLFDKRVKGIDLRPKKQTNRYIVTDDNGETREFATRNQFLKLYTDGFVPTGNKLCSRDFDYVYIEQDQVFLCAKEPIPIKEYTPVPWMHPCWRGPKGACTLCGNISIKTIPEFVFNK